VIDQTVCIELSDTISLVQVSFLAGIRGFELITWDFIGHDPKEFRHYGLMA
jgi:hypothetical protein